MLARLGRGGSSGTPEPLDESTEESTDPSCSSELEGECPMLGPSGKEGAELGGDRGAAAAAAGGGLPGTSTWSSGDGNLERRKKGWCSWNTTSLLGISLCLVASRRSQPGPEGFRPTRMQALVTGPNFPPACIRSAELRRTWPVHPHTRRRRRLGLALCHASYGVLPPRRPCGSRLLRRVACSTA